MIILVPILIYVLAILVLLWAVKFLLKAKSEEIRTRFRIWIIGLSTVLIFPLGFLYLSFLFGIAIDNHYDVKRGTFLWYATMDNETITQFPVIKPEGKVTYNSIGGDSPNIGTGWGINYFSSEKSSNLTEEIILYLRSNGYEIEEVGKSQYYFSDEKNEFNQLYSGSNEKGESLDLVFEKETNKITRIRCSIVF